MGDHFGMPDFDTINQMDDTQFRMFTTMFMLNCANWQAEQNGTLRWIQRGVRYIIYFLVLVLAMLAPDTLNAVFGLMAKAVAVLP